MKKRTISLIVTMILAVSTAFGQIIFTEEEQYAGNSRAVGSGIGVMVPMQNINTDQYKQSTVPLSGGLLLLAGLAGGYLLKKKAEVRSKK